MDSTRDCGCIHGAYRCEAVATGTELADTTEHCSCACHFEDAYDDGEDAIRARREKYPDEGL